MDKTQPETVHLLELCDTNPEYANKVVKEAAKHQNCIYTGIPYPLYLSRPVSTDLIGRMVCIEGAVIRTYEVLLKNVSSEHTCISCNTTNAFTDTETRERDKHPVCDACGSQHVKVNRHFSNSVSTQSIRIQDIANSAAMCETVEVVLEGSDVGKFVPGDKLQVVGIVMRRWKPLRPNETMTSTLYIRALSISCEELSRSRRFDGDRLFDLLKDLSIIEKRRLLIKSFCPEIYGQEHIKLALLVSVLGGNQGNTRSSIHMLLVGGHGTGKTHFLRAITKAIGPSVFVDGARVSSAGLTSYAIKQGKEWILEGGALSLSDRGVCCIDEFERLKVGSRGGLLEAMEQQTISVAKAGIVTTLSTRCSVIGGLRFDGKTGGGDYLKKLGISPPLISRFDLIMYIYDNRKEDWAKIEHVFKSGNTKQSSRVLPLSGLREYLMQVKTKKIEMSQEHSDLLLKYYLSKRDKEGRTEYNTVRMLESLVRISIAHAKLLGKDKVADEDVYTAMILAECCISSHLDAEIINIKPFDSSTHFAEASTKIDKRYSLK